MNCLLQLHPAITAFVFSHEKCPFLLPLTVAKSSCSAMEPLYRSLIILTLLLIFQPISAIQVLSKTKLEKCEKVSKDNLNCTHKIVIDLAVPSESVRTICQHWILSFQFHLLDLWVVLTVLCFVRVGEKLQWWQRLLKWKRIRQAI